MSEENQKRPQFKPTPELQKIVDAIAPSIRQSLKIQNTDVQLRCFSTYPKDPNRFTFFLNVGQKIYRAEIKQKMEGGKAKIQLLKLFQIKNK